MVPMEDYQLTVEEKRRRKKEKLKAKKFSDAEEMSDLDVPDPPVQSAVKKVMSFQTTNQKQNHVLTTTLEEKNESHDSSQSKPKYHVNGSKKNGRLQKHPASTRETPEKVLIEEPRATVSTIKGSDLLLLKKLDIDGRNQKPRNTYRRKYNDQLITYSQPPLTNGITTLTQTSGVRMSTGLTSTSSNQWDKGPVEKKPEVVVQTIYKPTEVTETIHFPRVYKKSGFRLSRAELVRRCNHDVARMIGKKFLDDQVCTKPRLIKLFLKAAVRGDVEQFKQLFDMSFQHARTVKCFENCSDIALKRIFMLKLLRVFIDVGTDSNLLMLLSACWQKTDDSQFIPCNKLENKHGYCQLIAFICQFFKPSELKIIFELRNSYSGRTALCIAAVAGNLCQMKVLLENGANPNTFDFLGYSPLYYAIKKSRKDMFLLLLHWGADLGFQHHEKDEIKPLRTYAKYACEKKEFVNFFTRRINSLHLAFLRKIKDLSAEKGRKIINVISELHTVKAFGLHYGKHHIDLRFEFNLHDRLPKPDQELVIFIIPFRFFNDDFYSDDDDPRFEFVDLKEVKTKHKVEILHDIIDGAPRFIDHGNHKVVLDFEQADIPKTTMTNYFFKLKRKPIMIPNGNIHGKLQFNTKVDGHQLQLFNKLLFGIQAFVMESTSGKLNKILEGAMKSRNFTEDETRKNTKKKIIQSTAMKLNQKNINEIPKQVKEINKKERQKREEKGGKAE